MQSEDFEGTRGAMRRQSEVRNPIPDAPAVLYVCSSADADGGMELFTLDLVRLSTSRWRTHLLLPEEGNLAEAARAAGATVHLVPYRRLRRPRRLLDVPVFLSGWLRLEWALFRLIRREGIGLVHFGDNIDAPFLPAARLAGAAVVCRSNFVPHSRAARWMLSRLCLLFCGRVLCVSQATIRLLYGPRGGEHPKLALLRSGGPDPEVFSPATPVPPLREELGLDPEAPLLGMVARFLPDKGHDLFLAVAERLLAEVPDCHFVVVGRRVAGHEAFYHACRARMERAPLAGRVTLIEDLAQTDAAAERRLAGLYRALDLLLHLPRCEDTFPTVILEAMACGLPVVALARGGIPEQVAAGETGLLISEGDCETITTGLISLLKQPELRREMGEAARRRVLELVGRDRLAREIEAVYRPFLERVGT